MTHQKPTVVLVQGDFAEPASCNDLIGKEPTR
jgi:hypothetical protein